MMKDYRSSNKIIEENFRKVLSQKYSKEDWVLLGDTVEFLKGHIKNHLAGRKLFSYWKKHCPPLVYRDLSSYLIQRFRAECALFTCPLENIPLYINSRQGLTRAIVKWRLKVAK
jgi:hypothetical protein